jgi:lipopolysaccharide export system permease protein
MLTSRASRETLLAELNQRLASPFLALSFTLIGVFSILAGEFNRRGMGKRILFASLAIIVLQASFMSVNSLITKHMDYAYALYVVAMAPIPLAFLLVGPSTGIPRRNKSRKRRMKS